MGSGAAAQTHGLRRGPKSGIAEESMDVVNALRSPAEPSRIGMPPNKAGQTAKCHAPLKDGQLPQPEADDAGAETARMGSGVLSRPPGKLGALAQGQGIVRFPTATPPVIQARLAISDHADGDLVEHNIADLQRLLGNSGASIRHQNGEISLQGDVSEEGAKHPGYRLLRRIIASGKTTTLHGKSDASKTEAKGAAADLPGASDPHKGSDHTVYVPPGEGPESVVQDDKGKITLEPAPRHIVLGHELIHADRAQRGVRAASGQAKYNVTGSYTDNTTASNTVHTGTKETFARLEELRTVGLTPTGSLFGGAINDEHDPDVDISENDLRKALGHKPVAAYEKDWKRLLTSLGKKKETQEF
jgi:hypothetical protein